MIDWLTLKLDRALVPQFVYDRAKSQNGMVMCITPIAIDSHLNEGALQLDERGQEKQRLAYANQRVIVNGNGEVVFRGVVTWEKVSRESIGSDSHKLVVEAAPHCLWIYGSPARVSQINNVFGKECIRDCALDMIKYHSRRHYAKLRLRLGRRSTASPLLPSSIRRRSAASCCGQQISDSKSPPSISNAFYRLSWKAGN